MRYRPFPHRRCVKLPCSVPTVSASAGDVDMSRWRVPAVSPRPPFHSSLLRVLAHSEHTGGLASQRDPKTHLSKTRRRRVRKVMSLPVTASCRSRCLKRAGHRWSRVQAITPRSKPSGQFCRVSFTNPFTSRATQSHPPADTPRWDATTAIEGLYRPLRSTEILAELDYHETRKPINRGERPDAAAARAGRLISEMTTAFDEKL
jgi:hypothetical protein